MVGRLYTSPMQLLVSVRNPDEAVSALEGGADIVDAKEPVAGALGPVPLLAFRQIVAQVGARRPVSAAAGDASDECRVESDVRNYAQAGAAFVKVGFAGINSESQLTSLIGGAARGAAGGRARLVAVAYADCESVDALPPDVVLATAIRCNAYGVLLDTVLKDGPALIDLMSPAALREWIREARSHGLMTAVAGRLGAADVDYVVSSGAEIVGVRGAACEGGREGRVSVEKVQRLRAALQGQLHHRASRPLRPAASVRTTDPRSPGRLHRQT